MVFVITKDSDSHPSSTRVFIILSVETLFVAVLLQGALRTKQRFPGVTAH